MFQFIDVMDFHLMNVIMLEIVALLMEQQPNVFVMMDFRVKIVKVSSKCRRIAQKKHFDFSVWVWPTPAQSF